MVQYDPCDVMEINDFAYAWRITDPRWSVWPAELRRAFRPLSPRRSNEICMQSPVFKNYPQPFDPGQYHATREISLSADNSAEDERIRGQLSQLPIALGEEVYICWRVTGGVAAVADWQTFVHAWSDLWYPFDVVSVLDESLDWAVVLGPEEYAVFIERGPVPPGLPPSDPAFGGVLVRCQPPGM